MTAAGPPEPLAGAALPEPLAGAAPPVPPGGTALPESPGRSTEWAWIGLGSNLGHRGRALACLRASLEGQGLAIEAASSEVLTLPVGVTTQGYFHNQVVLARRMDAWGADQWLRACEIAESACGRRPTYRWGPRRADADVLLLGRRGEVTSPDAPRVPHPEIPNRPFWGRLMAEIDPEVADRVG